MAYKHSWCSTFPEVVINSLHHERHSFRKLHTHCIPIHHVFFLISPVSKLYLKLAKRMKVFQTFFRCLYKTVHVLWHLIFVYRLIYRGKNTFSVPKLFPLPSLFQSRQLCWPCSAYLKLRGIFYNIYIYPATHPALLSPPHCSPHILSISGCLVLSRSDQRS